MSAERHITPRVVAYLHDAHAALTDSHVSFERVQLVLCGLCRWSRRADPDDPGLWVTTQSVRQVSVAVLIAERSVRDGLDVLARIGIAVTISHGGGRGFDARGSTRHLYLDPVDMSVTATRQRVAVDEGTTTRWAETRTRWAETTTRQRAPSVKSSVLSTVSRDDPVANIDRSDPGAYDPFRARGRR